MTLYVFDKRKDVFRPLSETKIKALRRVTQVRDVDKAVNDAVPTFLALATWLRQVDRRGKSLNGSDLVVARVPNCERIEQLAKGLLEAVDKAKRA